VTWRRRKGGQGQAVVYEVSRASGVDDYRRALREVGVPTQNALYVDDEEVYYQATGRIPIRRRRVGRRRGHVDRRRGDEILGHTSASDARGLRGFALLVIGDSQHGVTVRTGPDHRRVRRRCSFEPVRPVRQVALAVWTVRHGNIILKF
jgi:hypothetical protein